MVVAKAPTVPSDPSLLIVKMIILIYKLIALSVDNYSIKRSTNPVLENFGNYSLAAA